MPVNCDPSSLASAARCFDSCSRGPLGEAVKSYLLCQWASGDTPVGPEAPSNPDIDADGSVADSVIFTWTNAGDPSVTANEIWRSLNGGPFVLIHTGGPLDVAYIDNAPPNVAGDYWEYKVRAVSAAGFSSFTEPRGAAFELQNQAVPPLVYNYPYLVIHFGAFMLSGAETDVTFPLLRKITGDLSLESPLLILNLPSLATALQAIVIHNSSLTTISLPALLFCGANLNIQANGALVTFSAPVLVTIQNDFFGDTSCPLLANIVCTALAQVNGLINFSTNGSVNSVDFSSLLQVGGDMNFSGCQALTNFLVGNVQTIGGTVGLLDTFNLGDVHFPSLTSIGGDVGLTNCAALDPMDFPLLQTIGAMLTFPNMSGLQNASFPSLTSVGSTINFDSCGALITASFPMLVNINNGLNFSNTPTLTTVSMPNAIYADGITIDGSNCALLDTTVNQVLERGVASADTSCAFLLDGGTNAAPTGQGIVDAGLLTIAGNTVNTN